ncbi:MAG: hypothetical protein ABEJ79_00335 [Halolamina sp.]
MATAPDPTAARVASLFSGDTLAVLGLVVLTGSLVAMLAGVLGAFSLTADGIHLGPDPWVLATVVGGAYLIAVGLALLTCS